jgi:hypothetical protein
MTSATTTAIGSPKPVARYAPNSAIAQIVAVKSAQPIAKPAPTSRPAPPAASSLGSRR